VLPTYTQGKKVIWDGINEAGDRILDYIPRACVSGKPNTSEMKIRLVNGSIIQVIGSENYDSIRGTNPIGVVFSEFAMQEPRIWTEVVSPILLKNGGWAVFNTTPLGKNHAWELWAMSKNNEGWFTQILTINDTNLITKEMIDRERAEGKSEEIIQQEYYCSFERGIEGSYYARLMNKAREEKRIGRVPVDIYAKVYTYWDLGVGDSTSIWFVQYVGNEVHIIDYYENCGEGLPHYAKVLETKRIEEGLIYGEHHAPHDIRQRELNTGISRLETASALGITFNIVPNVPIEDGIEAVRALIPKCYFDEKKCSQGIKCIENYRKRWNDKMHVYSTSPLHDYTSHGADAFRYLAVRYKQRQGPGTALGQDEWKKARSRNIR
jgi:phage terminase large subunit